MTDDFSHNPEWWKDAKAESVARRRPAPSVSLVKPGDALLIVTEGTVTEPTYFRTLRTQLKLLGVKVEVRPGETPDPAAVVLTAVAEAQARKKKAKKQTLADNELAQFDHVFAVVDTDKAVQEGRWPEVERLAKQHKVTLIPSTPCFEFWLLLHLSYTTRTDLTDGTKAKQALRAALGGDYSTSTDAAQKATAQLLPKREDAVKNAQRVREHHQKLCTPAPANPSTCVDEVVTAMLAAVGPRR